MHTIVSTSSIGVAMPESTLRRSLAAGAALVAMAGAALYSLSPATAWLAVVVAVVIAWAARGLPPTERRWVIGILGVSSSTSSRSRCGGFRRSGITLRFGPSGPHSG